MVLEGICWSVCLSVCLRAHQKSGSWIDPDQEIQVTRRCPFTTVYTASHLELSGHLKKVSLGDGRCHQVSVYWYPSLTKFCKPKPYTQTA